MFTLRTALLSSLLLVSTTLFAHHGGSHDDDADGGSSHIKASQPWTRATPPGAGAGGGFVTLTNHGDQGDRLVSASTPITERTEIHTMEMDGEVMRMVPLPGGIEIPAGESVALAPGGLHLMFMDLPRPIVEGEPLPVTLEFQRADSIELQLQVVPVGSSPDGLSAHADQHQEHSHMAH
ncbi:copper chaperone PCu(A)C [Halomonas sp. GFAJ-1]|uniref:copper chaperone PCu(A)C n=1 Tax=Halomonas sp. GFAJ-1 TaxID=1118153 RepID=UPI00023A24D4|nr:copper chaperone PCu(A)C [Halomonas sp. GFAJ-1]AVI62091.1 hypothetical protein BB497_04915 [Halomonas sp. GFAJ-1]EHK61281.1 hypothetical protein MOY_07967 [Halomonas sp. GFAJ-1]